MPCKRVSESWGVYQSPSSFIYLSRHPQGTARGGVWAGWEARLGGLQPQS